MDETKVYTRADNGKLSKVVKYGSGNKVEVPINKDGSVKWYPDKVKKENN